jgi:hypothetical protein
MCARVRETRPGVPHDSSRGPPEAVQEDVMKQMFAKVILCLAVIVPAVGASQDSGSTVAARSSQAQVCAAGGNHPLTAVNPEYVWRLRAYEDLDCALAILDDALKAPGSAITLSRDEAERARASVWSARDAAARIGR